MEKNTSQSKMEEEQFVEICAEKMDDKRIEEKERKRDKEKDRDRERRRSKHKESRKAERKEGREREEHTQRRAIGEEVQIDKNEEEFKRIDYEGQIMDHGNSVIITQTPLSCGEDNLIIKDEKSGKSIRSGVAYNRGTAADSGSKGRSREERHGSAHAQHRGERDSKAGGEKLLDRSEKASRPESRKGGSESIRPASEERESWVDPYISPPLCRPKYSYRESMEKDDGADKHRHHERKRYPSPESLTEPSYHTAQILLSSAEPKGSHAKHRGADKTPRSEARDSNRKRPESRQSPNVHLYMSELAPPSSDAKMLTPNPHPESRAPGEHKRRSRRSAKDESGTGNSAHTARAPEEEEMADGRDDDKVKVVSDPPGDRGAAEATGNRGRSREDKGGIGHRGERDSKGGGEKVHDRWEISLPGDPPESRQGGPEKHRVTPEDRDRDVSESSSINPSSRRPKYSYRASLEKGESRGELEKHAAPYCMAAEPNLRTSQKMEYTVMSNIISPEARRKHLKHHKSGLPKDQQQVNGEAAAKELGDLQPDVDNLHGMEPDLAAPSKTRPRPPPAAEQTPSGVGDVPLPPEQPARKARKSSRDNKGATTAANSASESCKAQDGGSAAASKSEGNATTAAGVKSLENWGKRVSPELQAEAKHGVGPPEAEKRENGQGTRPPNSRRPRYSYGTNIDMEDEGFYPLNKSISSYSQWPVDSVLRVTKSEYMVASSSSSPASNRKLIKYTSCLAEQPSTLSNFINKAKQLEIATSMQPISAYGLPSKPCPLGSAGPTKGGPRGIYNGVDVDVDGASLTRKESGPGVQGELCATHRRRESQRAIHCKPFLHHLPDGDTDRGREEASPADVKLAPTHCNTSLRHRAAPSLGGTLTDGKMCVDIPRPIVSASRNSLMGMSPYGSEIVSSKIWTKCGHFKQQHQECPKRSLQTRKRYQEEVKAALMIQAAWKGYQTRAQIRKQAEAAVIIQAAYRGYQIRKFLTDGMGVNATDELNEAQDGHWQDSEYPEIFLEEISQSDYSESEPDSGDDWLDSPVSVIVGSPGSCGADNASREDPPPVEVYSPTPVLQYESVYQSQRCNWGEV